MRVLKEKDITMKHAAYARRTNTVDGRIEYWSSAGFVTDTESATMLPDDRYAASAPILTANNEVPVDLFTVTEVDTSADAWRADVASGATQRGYVEWRARHREDSTPELLVGIGSIDVYVYVDPTEGKVVRVVASDESLQDIGDLAIKAADINETPIEESLAAVTEEGRRYFRQIASSNAWPGWDFSW